MAEVQHACPHCGHGVGRLMRVKNEGVSNCAKCHKSDWSRRFPLPGSDPDRAQREAQEALRAQLDAVLSRMLLRKEEPADVKPPERNAPTAVQCRDSEEEELVHRVREEESNESHDEKHTKSNVKKSPRAYGGLVASIMAFIVIVAVCDGGDRGNDTSAKPAAAANAAASPSVKSFPPPSTSPPPSKEPVLAESVGDYQNWNLAKAAEDAHKHHVKSVAYTDLSELSRTVVHLGDWKVCSQSPDAGAYSTWTTVTFEVLKTNEACAWPPLPDSDDNPSSNGSSPSSSGGSTTTELCSIRSNAGNCYHAGEFCRSSDVASTTTDAAGREITCGYEAGANRWHY
ncbi:hypothetical protein ACFZAR_29720 [Streptomyces sp. NPDC008222]|uniref:hypothetical protein n=1 Tax=Streptomyces sp. NPDC008222 TaxID=3364820 RepID=UPI0036EE8530